MADLTGRRLGPYDLTKKLGQGGMGAVYEGVHRTLMASRAVKVLLPTEVDEGVVERFHAEGRISASLRHENIVQIFDVDEENDVHFLVMEMLEGQSLLQLLRSHGALPLERVIILLRQVADALDYAHARGVVHRDIKPSNVIVSPNDKVTLIDFGIARALDQSRMTRVGVVVGTFEYMAPEVVTEGGGSPGADRYALGIVAYQMLTGRVPFTGESAHSIMYRQVHDPPPPPSQFRPDLRGPAEDALLRQLAKGPDDRFASSQAFVDALAAPFAQPHPDTQATSIADITRPGFDRPTPGSGQTPMPRSGRVTRPVTAATLTPPGVRALPKVPPAPISRPAEMPAFGNTEAVFAPTMASAPPAAPAQPAPRAKSNVGLVVGLLAIVAVLAAVLLIPSLRQTIVEPLVGVTPTTAPAMVEQKPAVTPATPTAIPVVVEQPKPAITPATPTAVPVVVEQPKPVVTPATPVPQATLTPNQRLAQVRDTFEAGNHASALALLGDLRQGNPTLAGLDDAEYDIRMGFARTLLDQGNPDGAYEQFGGALKIRPGDAAAKNGQQQIILAKNYAIMEANWGKDDEAAIKALEENMIVDPGFRDTRPKLYSLLIGKADRLLEAGERDAAFEVLMRALNVQPDGGAAQQRLTTYTPTPTPVPPTPVPAPVYTAPATKPNNTAPSNTAPASKPSNTAPSNNTAPANNNPPPSSSNNCPGRVCF